MAKHNLYVLTGGPCTGKTSIGRQLAHNGYLVLPESARTVIQEQATKEDPILPTTDPVGFQLEVLHKQEQLEDFVRELGDLPHDGPVFLDRSKIDNLAYCRVFNIQAPIELMRACLQAVDNKMYSRVYLMDRIPYIQDAERTEDAELAKTIHYAIAEVYTELGYDLVRVADMDGPEPRAEFIEGTLEKKVYAVGEPGKQYNTTGEQHIYSIGAPMPPEHNTFTKHYEKFCAEQETKERDMLSERWEILHPELYGTDDDRPKNSPRLPNGMTLDEFATKTFRGE